jgi:amidase
MAPTRTPALDSDSFEKTASKTDMGAEPPTLTAEASVQVWTDGRKVGVSGSCIESELQSLHVYVDGEEVKGVKLAENNWEVQSDELSTWSGRNEERGVPDPAKTMVIVLAIGKNGRSTGKLLFA